LTQYNTACLCCYFGELDRALDLLERLLPHANHETKAWVKQDSDFAPLHEHPRWQRVLELAA
jgi:adenylate cyclase